MLNTSIVWWWWCDSVSELKQSTNKVNIVNQFRSFSSFLHFKFTSFLCLTSFFFIFYLHSVKLVTPHDRAQCTLHTKHNRMITSLRKHIYKHFHNIICCCCRCYTRNRANTHTTAICLLYQYSKVDTKQIHLLNGFVLA